MRISGETSKYEILAVIWELARRDPGKKFPDLWHVAGECQIPFVHLSEIAQGVRSLLPRDAVGNKTAIVAASESQKAEIEWYRSEASILPFEIRVFRSRDAAVEWIMSPEAPPSTTRRLQ